MTTLLLDTWIAFGLGFQEVAASPCCEPGPRKRKHVYNGTVLNEIGHIRVKPYRPDWDSVLVRVESTVECRPFQIPEGGGIMGNGEAFFMSCAALDRMAVAIDSSLNIQNPLKLPYLPRRVQVALKNGPRKP